MPFSRNTLHTHTIHSKTIACECALLHHVAFVLRHTNEITIGDKYKLIANCCSDWMGSRWDEWTLDGWNWIGTLLLVRRKLIGFNAKPHRFHMNSWQLNVLMNSQRFVCACGRFQAQSDTFRSVFVSIHSTFFVGRFALFLLFRDQMSERNNLCLSNVPVYFWGTIAFH